MVRPKGDDEEPANRLDLTINIQPVAHGDMYGPDNKLYAHEIAAQMWAEHHAKPKPEPEIAALIEGALKPKP